MGNSQMASHVILRPEVGFLTLLKGEEEDDGEEKREKWH